MERAASSVKVSQCKKAQERMNMQPDSGRQPVKRRKKFLKPGLTATKKERYFVKHNYHDHADEVEPEGSTKARGSKGPTRGGPATSFLFKLHNMLENTSRDHLCRVVSWQPHGRCFVIREPKSFSALVLTRYFNLNKLTSFQRQLNLYGFSRITHGKDAGGYYHELFLREKAFLCSRIHRMRVKGVGYKAASSPEDEPDFYSMKFLPSSPLKITPTGNPLVGPSQGTNLQEGEEKNSERDYLMRFCLKPTSVTNQSSTAALTTFPHPVECRGQVADAPMAESGTSNQPSVKPFSLPAESCAVSQSAIEMSNAAFLQSLSQCGHKEMKLPTAKSLFNECPLDTRLQLMEKIFGTNPLPNADASFETVIDKGNCPESSLFPDIAEFEVNTEAKMAMMQGYEHTQPADCQWGNRPCGQVVASNNQGGLASFEWDPEQEELFGARSMLARSPSLESLEISIYESSLGVPGAVNNFGASRSEDKCAAMPALQFERAEIDLMDQLFGN